MKSLLLTLALFGVALSAKLAKQAVDTAATAPEEPEYPPQPYNFGFEIKDDDTTNYQNRAEVSDSEGRVRGSYSYVLPDGFVYTVTYEDNKDGEGLKATVRKEPSGIEVIIPEPYNPERKAKSKALN